MKPTIIPLGGGCNGAIILHDYGLRTQSYPFDWLWNLDVGLPYVADMICSDFEHVKKRDDYVYQPHYQWPGQDTLVFKSYPKIAHLHTNPLECAKDLETYNRRIEKFRALMNTSRPVIFIYYRQYDIGEQPADDEAILNRMDTWLVESSNFMKIMRDKYLDKKITLISLFEVPDEFPERSPFKERGEDIVNRNHYPDIHFHFSIPRSDTDELLRKQWSACWHGILKQHKLIGPMDILLRRPRSWRKKMLRHYRKHFIKQAYSPEPDE
jgi:hypothetical protein